VVHNRLAWNALPSQAVAQHIESGVLKEFGLWFERVSRVWVPTQPFPLCLLLQVCSRARNRVRAISLLTFRPPVPVCLHPRHQRSPRFLQRKFCEGRQSTHIRHQRIPPAPHITFEYPLPGRLRVSRHTTYLQERQREDRFLRRVQRDANPGRQHLPAMPSRPHTTTKNRFPHFGHLRWRKR
jgi:hypothetical protein